MDTTETQNRQGSRDKGSDDNVVRLPRDWLGPREDLVPFGPSAYRDEPAPVTELPRDADSFWNGTDLLDEGDTVESPEVATKAPRQRSLRLWSPPRPRIRLGVALLFGLGAVVVLAGVGFLLGSIPGKPAGASSTHPVKIGPGFDAQAAALRNASAQHASRVRADHAAAVRRRAHAAARERHLRQERAARSHRHAPRAASSVEAVGYTTQSPADNSGGSGSSSASDTGATSSSPPATSSPPASTSSASASTASSAAASGSSNQPALGANGSLGPGSSPDG